MSAKRHHLTLTGTALAAVLLLSACGSRDTEQATAQAAAEQAAARAEKAAQRAEEAAASARKAAEAPVIEEEPEDPSAEEDEEKEKSEPVEPGSIQSVSGN